MNRYLSSVDKHSGQKAFTLIEILIVVAIIAILASTILPNFIGFDSEARVTATQSNLESLRTTVNLFRAKEGKYPDSLDELLTTYYADVGVKKPYLNKIPSELITSSKGNNTAFVQTSSDRLDGDGGWIYLSDTAEVKINVVGELGNKWGKFSDEKPAEW